MKRLLLLATFAVAAFGQAVFTPGTPAAAAVPAKLVATAGTGNTCTLTGNAFPATAIVFNCTVAGVTIQPFTVPFPSGSPLFALTFQVNSGTSAQTTMLSVTSGATGIAVQATVNGGTAVTGTF